MVTESHNVQLHAVYKVLLREIVSTWPWHPGKNYRGYRQNFHSLMAGAPFQEPQKICTRLGPALDPAALSKDTSSTQFCTQEGSSTFSTQDQVAKL